MDDKKKRDVLKALQQYVPIKRDIGSLSVTKAPKYLARLLKNNEELKTFLADSRKALQQEGIKPEEIDVPLFTELVIYLKERTQSGAGEYVVGATATNKKKEREQQWNFDNDKEYIINVETEAWRERGRSREKDREEIIMQDKNFKVRGVGMNPAVLLKPELRSLFFPTQPMVTPELIKKIKEILDRD